MSGAPMPPFSLGRECFTNRGCLKPQTKVVNSFCNFFKNERRDSNDDSLKKIQKSRNDFHFKSIYYSEQEKHLP